MVELVDIVVQRVVLLLSLDKRGDNLIDVSDACALLDRLEGLLDDSCIPNVLIQQLLLLLVLVHDVLDLDV